MALLAVAVGLLIGLSLGALGGGGSILTVPALVYLLGLSPHQATSASLLVVAMAALVGAISHARAGRVRLKAGMTFGALGVAGSYLGSRASAAVPPDLLLAGFGLLMLAAAAGMIARQWRSRRSPAPVRRAGASDPAGASQAVPPAPAGAAAPRRQAAAAGPPSRLPLAAAVPPGRAHAWTADVALRTTTPRLRSSGATSPVSAHLSKTGGVAGPPAPGGAAGSSAAGEVADSPARAGQRPVSRRPGLVVAAASAVGLITGFFGVGGGFLVVPVLVMVLGFDMATAAGTSLVVIAIDSLAALATRAGHGALSLDWLLVGLFTAAAALGAIAGGRLAGRASPRRLATAFTALIVVVAAYTLARSIPGLA